MTDHKERAHFDVAVNGQAARITADSEAPLSTILVDAILLTENERWGGVDRWECRSPRGELLDDATKLGDLVLSERGICVFIGLKPGVGA